MADGGPAFHLARTALERLGLDDVPASPRGDPIATDLGVIHWLAARLNEVRLPAASPILPGQLAALALLHELGHLVIAGVERRRPARGSGTALRALRHKLGSDTSARLLDRFGEAFPPPRGTGPEGPEARLAELLLIRVANENPAAEPLRDLIDDRAVIGEPAWPAAMAVLEATLGSGTVPADNVASLGLLAILRAPAAHAPTSLSGQLRYVRTAWVDVLGDEAATLLAQVDRALVEMAEEEAARQRGLVGHVPGLVEVPRLAGLEVEAQRFSPDADWMPGVVLQARSTYVWLDQLSRRHGREIRTLDAIPDEELDRLAAWGITGLWLIGVWERSRASEQIKHRRGNPDAMASAYAIDDYVVAAALGGDAALADLRDRALRRGIRLACDMVPNHMGIDSRWLIGRPDWFLSVPQPPYPAYTFSGPDLAPDPGVEIVLEDHYWDDSDAAVVFLRRDRRSGETRFIYHGNDGTSLPWNDTAQLDFLQAEVREHVIRTIVEVARRFPVIRFDAAMVLARQHVRRLWWPEPGAGGGVPSRGAHALTRAEFDRQMPAEFWREVVDRVTSELPGTLLLAEAFWLLEGYFVRTLGIHRVYNSAFMHMLRDDDIAAYRRLIRETVEFDPEILERYVNFMSNPDEVTAVEQFGRGDKYFGVATVLATLPGLPMLGHGQVEGLAEKYGMEFRRPGWDEKPNAGMIERHEREIAPLLRERGRFARATDFRLYDLVGDDGVVDERVLAYSNGRGPSRSLVVYLGAFGDTSGWLRESTSYAVKGLDGSKLPARQHLADALELGPDAAAFVGFRDRRTGLEYLRSVGEIRARGLQIRLEAYGCVVFDGFREFSAGSGRWAELAARLGAAGVPSLDDALRDLELEPLHDRLRALVDDGHLARLAAAMEPVGVARAVGGSGADPGPSRDAVAAFAGQLAATGGDAGTARYAEAAARERIWRALDLPRAVTGARPLLAPLEIRLELVLAIALAAPSEDAVASGLARDRFDRSRLASPLFDALRAAGLDEGAAGEGVARIRAVIGLATADAGQPGQDDAVAAGAILAARWLEDPAVREAAAVNRWEGVDWFVQESWEAVVDLWALLSAVGVAAPDLASATIRRAADLQAVAEEAGYRLDRLHVPADDSSAATELDRG